MVFTAEGFFAIATESWNLLQLYIFDSTLQNFAIF